ncbi:MAG: thiol peroxidase [Planctomycetes bacterium]|nr:thiol peroxidase [Planctomycetota bacterium]
MAQISFKGNPVHTNGELPAVGSVAPAFQLTAGDLSEKNLGSYAGKKKILNIVPSLDTGVCQTSARTFNKKAADRAGVVVLCVSRDLPFAQKRFCAAEGIEAVIPLSEMRDRDFGRNYGCAMTDGPLAGLLARAVVVLNEKDEVIHAELVPEITQEPDYDAALAALD